MNLEIAHLIVSVKRELKSRGLTYRDVARSLKLSEASVKRLFSTKRFTVHRLAQVAQLLGLSLNELMHLAASTIPAPSVLTSNQEAQLVGDDKLLLVAVCALNHWSLQEIVAEYQLTRQEAQKRLILLDRMGLIELLPGDRVRRRVRRDFAWLPDGPIQKYFSHGGLGDFLAGPFDQSEELLEFTHGMLTSSAQAHLKTELSRFRDTMATLHEESVPTSMSEKRGVSLLLAMRRWEPATFRKLRRN